MAYSNGSGGTLTLPSPTHAHHVDMTAAVRSLRRSLSRSPSKFNLSATPPPAQLSSDGPVATTTPQAAFPQNLGEDSTGATSSNQSQNLTGPLEAATPTTNPGVWPGVVGQSATTSLSSRFLDTSTAAGVLSTPTFFSLSNSINSTTTPTPFRSSLKLSVRSARPKALTRPMPRTRGSPKSPLRRVFGASNDCGNVAPVAASPLKALGQENFNDFAQALPLSPTSRRNLEKSSRHSMHLDVSGSSKHGVSRIIDNNNDLPTHTVSPLKRSDAIMNLDQASLGSPVAKRRSLHGISSLSNDFNIFDQPLPASQNTDAQDETNQEYQLSGSTTTTLFREAAASPSPAVTRRNTSLRKSTLQQRHDGVSSRSSWGRRAGEKQLAQLASMENGSPSSRFRPRLSLDQYVPLEPERSSPFTAGPLPNPSAHPVGRTVHQPHPLSRAISQSSSSTPGSQDETVANLPAQFGERPRAPLNFAKSLPPGASRAFVGTEQGVATPAYKNAKPYQGVFMSTGLVSKMNRNPEQGPANKFPAKPAFVMPDTPCKKQSYPSATYPPHPVSGRRSSRPSLGSPTTPFGSSAKRGAGLGADLRGDSLFRSTAASPIRRNGLFSMDGVEDGDMQEMLPPTPTKSLFRKSIMPGRSKKATSPLSTTFERRRPISPSGDSSPSMLASIPKQDDGEASVLGGARPTTSDGESPVTAASPYPAMGRAWLRRRASGRFVSTRSTAAQAGSLGSPSTASFAFSPIKNDFRKTEPAVSSFDVVHETSTSPKSPMKSMLPPDNNRLSLFNPQEARLSGGEGDAQIGVPPATPTMEAREVFLALEGVDRRLSMTPNNRQSPSDVDEDLLKYFDKADIIGSGEFSTVYRVTERSSQTRPVTFNGFSTPSWRSPRSPRSPQQTTIYAVKKIRLPPNSVRMRRARWQEVDILTELRHCDKVVQYVRSWDNWDFLYIMTEFCEEGSLEQFLKSAGNAGRIDDFRIWKILVEASEGLMAIHAANIIHLDIKPANILVNREGYLKIADFGLATRWPAEKGIEGEGDREYIGPEILNGQYDKPADVFALGLIILEMACNVFLPDNGPAWQALRSGDLAAVGPLTSPQWVHAARDATGIPLSTDPKTSPLFEDHDFAIGMSLEDGDHPGFPFELAQKTHNPSNLFGPKESQAESPPEWFVDPLHEHSLDRVVLAMLKPNPAERPTAEALLQQMPLKWVSQRRLAGATVYEGNWGNHSALPPMRKEENDSPMSYDDADTVMTDV